MGRSDGSPPDHPGGPCPAPSLPPMAIVDHVRTPARPLDVAAAAPVEVLGLRHTLAGLLRWSPFVAVAVLTGWIIGAAVPDLGRSERAHVTVGLTDVVQWPFYDAVMARQGALVEQDTFRAAAEATVGVVADRVAVELDAGQTDAVMRILVEAPSQPDAIALAAALADGLITADLEEQRTELQARIAAVGAQVVEEQSEIDALDTRRDQERLARDSDAAEMTQAQIVVKSGELARLEGDLERAEQELAEVAPRVEVVAPATAGSSRPDRVRASVVMAALLGLLAVAAVPSIDRRRGRVRSAGQVRQIWPAVPIVDERRPNELLGADLASVVGELAATRGDVIVLAADERVADRVPRGTAVIVWGSGGVAALLADAPAVVVAVPRGSTRRRRLQQVADELVALGVRPSVVVLTRAAGAATGDDR